MQSRRDCKRDLRFDRLLTLLYRNIRSYEEQVRAEAAAHSPRSCIKPGLEASTYVRRAVSGMQSQAYFAFYGNAW